VEQKASFSNAGPGVDVFAAGRNIVSAGSNRVTVLPAYPQNSSFKVSMDTGTSQASPQVAGMCALYLQTNPTATPAQVKAWIVNSANTAVINRGGAVDYTNDRSLFGSSAGVAYLKSSANITNVSKAFAKEQSGNWREVASIFVKQNNTDWVPVKTGYIKTTNGWKTTYKQGN
jgi:subtilisin family serine protease